MSLVDLPPELILQICENLDKKSIKALGISAKVLHHHIQPTQYLKKYLSLQYELSKLYDKKRLLVKPWHLLLRYHLNKSHDLLELKQYEFLELSLNEQLKVLKSLDKLCMSLSKIPRDLHASFYYVLKHFNHRLLGVVIPGKAHVPQDLTSYELFRLLRKRQQNEPMIHYMARHHKVKSVRSLCSRLRPTHIYKLNIEQDMYGQTALMRVFNSRSNMNILPMARCLLESLSPKRRFQVLKTSDNAGQTAMMFALESRATCDMALEWMKGLSSEQVLTLLTQVNIHTENTLLGAFEPSLPWQLPIKLVKPLDANQLDKVCQKIKNHHDTLFTWALYFGNYPFVIYVLNHLAQEKAFGFMSEPSYLGYLPLSRALYAPDPQSAIKEMLSPFSPEQRLSILKQKDKWGNTTANTAKRDGLRDLANKLKSLEAELEASPAHLKPSLVSCPLKGLPDMEGMRTAFKALKVG